MARNGSHSNLLRYPQQSFVYSNPSLSISNFASQHVVARLLCVPYGLGLWVLEDIGFSTSPQLLGVLRPAERLQTNRQRASTLTTETPCHALPGMSTQISDQEYARHPKHAAKRQGIFLMHSHAWVWLRFETCVFVRAFARLQILGPLLGAFKKAGPHS